MFSVFQKPLPVEGPSFCYILTSDENDNISIKPYTVDVVHSKPVMFEQLAVLKTEMNTRRCSCTGRVLYVHHLHVGGFSIAERSGDIILLTHNSTSDRVGCRG